MQAAADTQDKTSPLAAPMTPTTPLRPTGAPLDASPSIPLAGATTMGALTAGAATAPTTTMHGLTAGASDTSPSIPLASPTIAPLPAGAAQPGTPAPSGTGVAGTVGGGSGPLGTSGSLSPPPPAAPAAPASPIPLATGGTGTPTPYANLSAITPGGATDYTDKTITPGAGVDRVKLANDVFESSAKASDPYYQKALRDATSAAAGNGQLGSGQLRTSLGDEASNRALQLDTLRSGLMHDATSGSIEDQYKNLDIARQQQGFQAGRQDTAFTQGTQQAALEEALRSGDFSRAAQMLALGNAGNPSDTALQLANSYGNQAGAAGSAAGNLISNSVRNSGTNAPAAPTDTGGSSTFDWTSLLGSLPGLSGDLPPIQQTEGGGILPIDTGWKQPVSQPKYPTLSLAGA